MKLRGKENRCDTCSGYIPADNGNAPLCRNSGGVPISREKAERIAQKGCFIWTPGEKAT